jgi:tRNA G18 (ribose-2'-O)-methylase SpoU
MQEPILDADDPRVAPFHPLRERSQRAHSGWVWAEGETAATRLLASGWAELCALTTPARAERVAAAAPAGCAVWTAEPAVLRQVVGYDLHRGCVAAARRPDLRLSLDALEPRGPLRVVVAEGVSDPVNVGALIRNARAFGVDLVIVDPRGADPLVPRAVRASMGNVFAQPLAVHDPLDALRALAGLGCETLAATVDGASVRGAPVPERWALALGHEGHGLSEAARALCARTVTVPLQEGADSLNVAAAGAVLLYALTN